MATQKSLQAVKDLLEKEYGASSVMMASEVPQRPAISSGSLALDFAIGQKNGGGFPSDRCIEVAGPEGTGKTTLALLAMSNFLDAHPERGAIIIDTEHKLSTEWVEELIGSDRMSRVILVWPDDAEQATSMYVKAVGTGQICFVLYDSIAASPTRKSMEDVERAEYGGASKEISRWARIAGIYSQKYHCLTLGINQVRADMEGFRRMITPGGHAWKHACVLRIQLKRGQGQVLENLDGEKVPIGYEVAAKVVKNQLGGVPGRVARYWFFNVPTEQYGFGIDTTEEVVRLATITEVIERKGGWYHHPALDGGRILGKDKLQDFIRDDRSLYATLRSEVMARLVEHADQVAPIEPEEDEGEQRTTYGNILKDAGDDE